jgi:glutamate synthase (NADPH/NADH) large chain
MTERKASGLYDPAFERDSCGFGLIANLDDMPSHWVVETAISALARLTHRGAVAADGKTGDGCGLLIKFPRAFLRAVGEELGFVISERFAAGTVFLSQDDKAAAAARAEIDRAVAEIGLESSCTSMHRPACPVAASTGACFSPVAVPKNAWAMTTPISQACRR